MPPVSNHPDKTSDPVRSRTILAVVVVVLSLITYFTVVVPLTSPEIVMTVSSVTAERRRHTDDGVGSSPVRSSVPVDSAGGIRARQDHVDPNSNAAETPEPPEEPTTEEQPEEPTTEEGTQGPEIDTSAIDQMVAEGPRYLQAVWEAVKRGSASPDGDDTIPVFITPLFHDPREFSEMLVTVTVPVRLFVFVWNSDNSEMAHIVAQLRKLPLGVHVHHHPENIGFSGAVNTGILDGNRTLAGPPARWFFVVNADTRFPSGSFEKMATRTNREQLWMSHGLVYGWEQEHYAFIITVAAVNAVGLMDEVFYPGYMEDIDYHWRVRIAGLPQLIVGAHIHHHQSSNMKKKSLEGYRGMYHRVGGGLEYGWMKWGDYTWHHRALSVPISGWKTPFNIPGAPLSLWKIDPAHRECIRTGRGTYHVRSTTCWYNGTVLYDHPDFPKGETLTPNLLQPHPSGAWSFLQGRTRHHR